MTKRRAIYFTEKELDVTQHILWHFADYISGDNRPDYGLGILSGYRTADKDTKSTIAYLAGRLRRLSRKSKL